LDVLTAFGLDIERRRGKDAGYYIASRQFELPELKLLVDAVQSSRFITEKKSGELIAKLASLTSCELAKQLRRQVFVAGRAKSFNETAYYSVDVIHAAIDGEKKIAFRYFDYDVKKRRVYRKNGGTYTVTPVTLCWDSDKYYLIAYSAEHGELRHYRVDRMSEAEMLDECADDFDRERFNAAEHIRRVFGMYSGETVCATLSFDVGLVNVILDYFGKDAAINALGEDRFEVVADVSVSPVFLGWMFQFGERAEIIAPDSLRSAMRGLIEANVEKYRS
jgi:predicted DNA-binding transcriptional regulator YafY